MSYNTETEPTFGGYKISTLLNPSKRIKWSPRDLITLYRHMSRYQITSRSTLGCGLDELARYLGISDKSTWYEDPVLQRAKSCMLYHVENKFREGMTKVLVQMENGEWRWPVFTLTWLRRDWDEDCSPGEDWRVREDQVGVRARTPDGRNGEREGSRQGRRDERRERLLFMSGGRSRGRSTLASVSPTRSRISSPSSTSDEEYHSDSTIRPKPHRPKHDKEQDNHDSYKTLESRLARSEMRTKYMLKVFKTLVPWKQSMDAWRISSMNPPAQGPELSFPHVPTTEPSSCEPSEESSISEPPPPSTVHHQPSYSIPPNATITPSRRLLSSATMYATLEMQHSSKACVARILSDEEESWRHDCGASYAGALRRDAARRALEAVMEERQISNGIGYDGVGGRGGDWLGGGVGIGVPEPLRRLTRE
ncbi:hypothetical protein FSPOR_11241 [Fusarium sporotrichioides]|uniref:Uncharacterized protein n=1 Tax=Fusarium sporotrichioides TaxID=5514 RepID=A0A395RIC6_FUSSP|nr:hypothetical protein FSPOR_11241 [Fusarium sporotrichioides]